MKSSMLMSALLLAVGAPLVAQASTVATFSWVPVSGTGPTSTETGTLQLTLPDTISSLSTFTASNAGSSAAALAEITGFSYTFSTSTGSIPFTVGLADLNLSTSSVNADSGGAFTWRTSNQVTPSGGTLGFYLITGFTLKGSKVFAGDSRAANFQIANSAGLVGLVAPDSNNLTPFTAGAAVDSGYWRLTSVAPSAVPLPAAAWLLGSGLAGLGALRRRRRSA
jgi:hypothetical protein